MLIAAKKQKLSKVAKVLLQLGEIGKTERNYQKQKKSRVPRNLSFIYQVLVSEIER